MTKPLPKEDFLQLENYSLKLSLLKHSIKDMEIKLFEAAREAFLKAGLDTNLWSLDLDKGIFVSKQEQQTETLAPWIPI